MDDQTTRTAQSANDGTGLWDRQQEQRQAKGRQPAASPRVQTPAPEAPVPQASGQPASKAAPAKPAPSRQPRNAPVQVTEEGDAPEVVVRPVAVPEPQTDRAGNFRPVLLTSEMVEAGDRIYRRLPEQCEGEAALFHLAERCPGFGREEILVKVVSLNALAGPHVLSRAVAVRHLQRVMAKADPADPMIVDRLADIPMASGKPSKRKQHGFASKFAHYFIDAERFPVMDAHAAKMLRFHLGGRSYVVDESSRYREFESNSRRLRGLSGHKGSRRAMGRYLWVAGQYLEWSRSPRAKINRQLAAIFNSPAPDAAEDIKTMMPQNRPACPWL
ncbi:MAG: hypothetical protein JJU33_14950 [Phycisphaerales bacterium]|nr:hypothetical protein [Phycisphaerales bacterium]